MQCRFNHLLPLRKLWHIHPPHVTGNLHLWPVFLPENSFQEANQALQLLLQLFLGFHNKIKGNVENVFLTPDFQLGDKKPVRPKRLPLFFNFPRTIKLESAQKPHKIAGIFQIGLHFVDDNSVFFPCLPLNLYGCPNANNFELPAAVFPVHGRGNDLVH